MAILYPGPLPPGALIRARAPGAVPIWLAADPAALTLTATDPARAAGWTAQGGGHAAVAVAANRDGTRFADGALRFEAGVNGGMMLPDAVPDGASVSLGLIFCAQAEGKTLATLQARGQEGYVFLAARGAEVRLAQTDARLALSVPVDAAGPVLVLCSLGAGRARLSVNGGAVVEGACHAAGIAGLADLFIGCRGPRAGLRNKLGEFALSDLFVWPGQDVLAGPPPAMAIDLWQTRMRDAL